MVVQDIRQYSEIRPKARAYFCYLFHKNLPNHLPSVSVESITSRLLKIRGDLQGLDATYLLDAKGNQVGPTYLKNGKREEDIGVSRSTRAYYYRAMNEHRCTITDPYPSLLNDELTVTASQPIFDEHGEIVYVACIDMPLAEVLRIAHPLASESIAGKFFRIAYAVFTLALAFVSLLLFVKGIEGFLAYGFGHYAKIEIKDIFEATILLTLSLAIFDLVKTLFEEEVLGRPKHDPSSDMHKTMVRFLGSIIIALSIEALMLVFKFAMTEPAMLINAIYIIGAVALLLVGLAIYIHFTHTKEIS
ncbi:MAG: PDC sensor domain-containing protein [Sulfuricurvum sp.]|uniref:PDC sensor domain-containing protein n=1 Tax=Sulfuricurvum sp. TaxID=2025608 RepID=UPI002612BE76|nr:PDC sensor domain-containing protein [Sulfuricurvum sp.]MDD2369267.1 PDC sensor domain-containing protein [Sulfuricurvum sp.]MDD2949666.1 PDC sensor domain-containing protein [Sulfuricurvum sp.]MDD5117296.1 PDC sensor domain-containing protein [Sulfuricurvum sp.]